MQLPELAVQWPARYHICGVNEHCKGQSDSANGHRQRQRKRHDTVRAATQYAGNPFPNALIMSVNCIAIANAVDCIANDHQIEHEPQIGASSSYFTSALYYENVASICVLCRHLAC